MTTVSRALATFAALVGFGLAGDALAQPAAPAKASAAAIKDPFVRQGGAPLETLAANKARVMRAAFVDGYDRDAGVIAFIRAPGEEPRVEVRMGSTRPLTAVVSARAWNDLVQAGAVFDRDLQPRPPANPATAPLFCLHPWSATVEAVDADGRIRRKAGGSCPIEPTLAYAFAARLAQAAVAEMPACAMIDDRDLGPVRQLAQCGLLSGDRAAAAEALNVWNTPWFANPRGPDFARSQAYLFHDKIRLAWPGEAPVEGPIRAAEVWAAKAGEARFQVRRVHGETADRVRMEGAIQVDGPLDAYGAKPRIPMTILWTRENGFGFRVRDLIAETPEPSQPR
ncbi:hypothetical protein AS593_20260 [Caulobacter vibrioides]|nr:hypothetical protein AS593_20260 [Caulobacter vibrioides]